MGHAGGFSELIGGVFIMGNCVVPGWHTWEGGNRRDEAVTRCQGKAQGYSAHALLQLPSRSGPAYGSEQR